MYKFDTQSDYKAEFRSAVTRIVRQDSEDFTAKNRQVQGITDAYLAATGERPESRELDELSSWLIFGRKGVSQRKKIEIKAQEEAEINGRS